MAESGISPNTISRTGDYGLMQINQVHRDRVGGNLAALLDPETNLQVAAAIYHEQGWLPWVTYQTGAYKKYV